MSNVAIPDWSSQGVLPPTNPNSPTSTDRSPYLVSLTDIVLRFGTSPERKSMLAGFLAFRSALHVVGLTQGFQWVDGSFLENVEMIESRAPRDLDVVTFFYVPSGQTQLNLVQASPCLFDPVHTKVDYNVDAYFVQLNNEAPESLVGLSAYWYSMWSHRRNEQWKGYLQIDLSPTDDQVAKANLDKQTNQGGRP